MAATAEPKELAALNRARLALEKASTFEEIIAIRDTAEAARVWFMAAKLSVDTCNLATETKLRAERKAGELLTSREKHKGGRPAKTPCIVQGVSFGDLGIEMTQAHRWQRIASVPKKVFESHVEETKAAHVELTSAGMLRLAKSLTKEAVVEARATSAKSHGILNNLNDLVAAGAMFPTIYADPPWAYTNHATRANVKGEYAATMSVGEICAEPVAQLVPEQAHLHLWTTNAFLFEARRVIEAWGFEYKSCFVWVKTQMGIGNYWRVSHEFMLLGVRGGLRFADKGQRSWIQSPRTEHSEKPRDVRKIIELTSPAPYLEMYGRHLLSAPWTVYGNEVASERQEEFL